MNRPPTSLHISKKLYRSLGGIEGTLNVHQLLIGLWRTINKRNKGLYKLQGDK
jgi:hypothetical protein